jgi:hypothetical protein
LSVTANAAVADSTAQMDIMLPLPFNIFLSPLFEHHNFYGSATVANSNTVFQEDSQAYSIRPYSPSSNMQL